MGRFEEAKRLLLESVLELAAAGASGIDQSRALINLAAAYRAQGDTSKAEEFALRAVGVLEKLPDGTPAERLGPQVLLASIYVDQQRLTEAESILRSGLDAADGALAVAIYGDLATISIRRGNFAEAEAMARQALRFASLALPGTHPLLAASWNNLGQACRLRGDYLHAEKAYREAIDIWEKSLGSSHPDVAKGLMNLGTLYHERGRESGAENLYRRAIAILEGYFGAGNRQTLVARSQLADILRAQHRFSESKMLCQNTLAELEKILPPDDLRLRQTQSNCGRLPRESGR
jgi:tetratricopeptide (TPR) repeat protein